MKQTFQLNHARNRGSRSGYILLYKMALSVRNNFFAFLFLSLGTYGALNNFKKHKIFLKPLLFRDVETT